MDGLKRAACDRCHGQKMKCMRAPRLSKCNRCQASQAECIFSPAKKLGRPPAHKERHSPHICGTESLTILTQHHSGPLTPVDSVYFPSSAQDDSLDLGILTDTDADLLSFLASDDATGLASYSALGTEFYPFGIRRNQTVLAAPINSFRDGLQAAPDQMLSQQPVTPQTNAASTVQTTSGVSQKAMQKLSELSGKLLTQVNNHTHNDRSTARPSFDRLSIIVEDVMTSSVAFLEILALFHEAELAVEVDPMSPDADSLDRTLDTATLLQVLTVYIRLTQLHQTLYACAQVLLCSWRSSSKSTTGRSNSESSTASLVPSIPALFPSLHIGAVSLSDYPQFQLKFVLQICVHQLGEMETKLGLPVEFRVGELRRSSVFEEMSYGIPGLGSGRTALLVRTVMMEIEQPVRAIRQTLATLREELQVSIQV